MAGIDVNVLKSYLQFGLIYVEFTKKDGTLRKMWCTRDNGIVIRTGHDLVQFTHRDAKARERNGMLFVYDIQEHDVRMLNSRTVDAATLVHYEDLDDVEIPAIKTRFEIEAERALNVDSGLVESELGGKDAFDVRSDATREAVRKAGVGVKRVDVGTVADTALEDALKVSGTGAIDLSGAASVAGREERVTLSDGLIEELVTEESSDANTVDVLSADDFFGASVSAGDLFDMATDPTLSGSVSSVTDDSISDVVPATGVGTVETKIEEKRVSAEEALDVELGSAFPDEWLL